MWLLPAGFYSSSSIPAAPLLVAKIGVASIANYVGTTVVSKSRTRHVLCIAHLRHSCLHQLLLIVYSTRWWQFLGEILTSLTPTSPDPVGGVIWLLCYIFLITLIQSQLPENGLINYSGSNSCLLFHSSIKETFILRTEFPIIVYNIIWVSQSVTNVINRLIHRSINQTNNHIINQTIDEIIKLDNQFH